MSTTEAGQPPTTHEEAARRIADEFTVGLADRNDLARAIATYATTVERETLERAAGERKHRMSTDRNQTA